MENSNLNFGKIISRVLTLIIVKPIVLPLKIYKNTCLGVDSKIYNRHKS